MRFAEPDQYPESPDMPTIEAVAAGFPVLLVTLAPQPSLHELAAAVRVSTSGGEVQQQTVAVSYAVLRNLEWPDDPSNHVEVPADVAEAIANPSPLLPAAAAEMLPWMRFPLVLEAVQTHVVREHLSSAAERLAEHMCNVLMNTFRDERVPDQEQPWEVSDAPAAEDAVPTDIEVDGVEVDGIRIDDEHVLGLAVELEDAVATVVWPKHLLPLVRLELTRRPRP